MQNSRQSLAGWPGKRSVSEADMATIEKEGIDTGFKAIHPVTGEKIPIWVGNFVLMSYGSGAVMSVPGHDQRDWEFARKFNLESSRSFNPRTTTECDLDKKAFHRERHLYKLGRTGRHEL